MSETPSHKRAKSVAAGPAGKTEVPLPRNRRLDALSPSGRATEIERSGSKSGLQAAARRLRDAAASQRVLQVPQKDMPAAAAAMRKVGIHGTVKNMTATKKRSI
jgi:hypothetical protein